MDSKIPVSESDISSIFNLILISYSIIFLKFRALFVWDEPSTQALRTGRK